MKQELGKILQDHKTWIETNGSKGNRANLSGANLSGANLRLADLSGANLSGANLSGANLRLADLSGANLSWANLSGADLSGANLRLADLRWADLSWAKIDKSFIQSRQICPKTGSFIGYKKLLNGLIATLRIPANSTRVTAIKSRKCRAKFVTVLKIEDGEHEFLNSATNCTSLTNATYKKNRRTTADKWDGDPRHECTHGIHFFMTREEAEAWNG